MAADSFDDDWGDFVSTPSAQIAGQDSPVVTRADSAPSWVKPSGSLPLSLFGDAEEEKSGAGESVFGYGEPILFSHEKKKDEKGSRLNGGVGIGDLIASLYGRSENINTQNESVANSSNRTQNGHNTGFHNVDSSLSNYDSGVSGLNSNSNGLGSDLVQQSENFDYDDDDEYGWEFKGADGNELEHQTVEAPPGLKVEIVNAKDCEIQVDGCGRVKVVESKAATASSNGLPGLVDTSIQSSNTSNEVDDWNFTLDFNPSSMNQNDIWDSLSKSKEKTDAKIGSDFSFVAENGNSKHNFWQFEDAFSGAGTDPQFEAAKVSALADLVIQTVNGDGAPVPTNFFYHSEDAFHRPEQWDHGFTFSSGSEHEDIAISHVTFKCKENDTGEGLNSSQGDKHDEFEENVWEFRDAYSDTGSKKDEDSKVSPDPPANIIPPGLDDGKNQSNEMRSGSHQDALTLSLFGDEGMETNASSVDQDVATHTFTSYTRNNNYNSSSNLSINDLISSLYGQAEQSISGHNATKESENEPHSVVLPEESDLVYLDDDFDDDSWEFKDASRGAKDHNQTFVTCHVYSPTKSSATSQLDHFIDFYCKLKHESCYIALNHFESLKKAQSSIVKALGEDTQEFYDQLCRDNTISEFHLENLSQRSSGISELFQVLHEPKFSVLDSKFHLSNFLSQAETDLESAVKLSQHAASTLRILKLGSAEEQSIYVSTWSRILSVCAQELKHGASVWNQALQKRVVDQILSEPRGRQYITTLGEIYRVVQILGASAKLYKPWVLLNSEGPGCLYALLNECFTLWSTSGLDEAIQSISEPIDSEFDRTLTDLLGSIKHVHNLDSLALHDLVFSSKEPLCRLSMLTPGIVPGIKLVLWDRDQYFLKIANLWANLISSNPPDLPRLNIS